MIRPFTWETARYGAVSRPDDSVFDHPFQWGSRRIGPDLARVGGKYSDSWHYRHLRDPREMTTGSNMPPYGHLAQETLDFGATPDKLRAMRAIGVPYSPESIQTAADDASRAAQAVAQGLAESDGLRLCASDGDTDCDLQPNSRMVALIAFLQRLGQVPPPSSATASLAPEVSR